MNTYTYVLIGLTTLTSCYSHDRDSLSRHGDSSTVFGVYGHSNESSSKEAKECIARMITPLPGKSASMSPAEADLYCKNWDEGIPDQNPPLICGHNAVCPPGIPDGTPKFNAVPMPGISYMAVGGGLYGTMTWQQYGRYFNAMGGSSTILTTAAGPNIYAQGAAPIPAQGGSPSPTDAQARKWFELMDKQLRKNAHDIGLVNEKVEELRNGK